MLVATPVASKYIKDSKLAHIPDAVNKAPWRIDMYLAH